MRRAFTGLIGAVLAATTLVAVPATTSATPPDPDLIGTVLDSTGAPVINGDVWVYDTSGGWLGDSLTDATGNYEISGLPAGDVVLYFSGQDVVSEYYDDAVSLETATPVTVGGPTVTVDAALTRYGTIHGTVTLPNGDPANVANVQVSSESFSASTATDSAGEYSLSAPPGSYTLQVTPLPGSGARSEYWENATSLGASTPIVLAAAATQLADVQLAAAGSLSGTVTDSSGSPIPNVDVQVMTLAGGWAGSALTDASGQYSIAEVNEQSVILYFAAPWDGPFVSEYHEDAETTEAATTVTVDGAVVVDATLRRLATIEGTVTTLGGDPVSGVFVSAQATSATGSATTDAAGHYAMFVEPGSYTVRFRPFSGSGVVGEFWDDSPTRAGATPIVTSTGSTYTADAQLAAAGSVSGTVTGAGAVAIEGVTVTLLDGQGDYLDSTMTDAAGAYSFAEVNDSTVVVMFDPPMGSGYLSEYHHDADSAETATPVTVSGATVVDEQLGSLGILRGTVTLAGGDPSVGSTVHVEAVSGGGVHDATTAADGTYTITGVLPGSYRVFFGAPAGTNYIPEYHDNAVSASEATAVTVAPDSDQTIDAELALGGSISGVVTSQEGNPLADAAVYVVSVIHGNEAVTTTDPSGHYALTGLLPSSYRVHFSASSGNHLDEFYENARSQGDATFVGVLEGIDTLAINASLERGGSISGTVVDDLGNPIVDASVTVSGASYGLTFTDADGNYVIDHLLGGEHTMQIEAFGFVSEFYDDASDGASSTPISVTLGSATTGIDVALQPVSLDAGSITGVVSSAGGAPIEGASVFASRLDGSGFGHATTGPDGAYTISGLPVSGAASSYRVWATKVGFVIGYWDATTQFFNATPVSVEPSSTVSGIDLVLDAAGALSGTVTADGVEELGSVIVSAYDEVANNYESTSIDPVDGTYAFADLAPGDYQVSFTPLDPSPYLEEYWADATSAAGATLVSVGGVHPPATGIDAVLTLGGVISGQVTNSAGQPERNVTVVADGPTYRSTKTDTNGNYTIRRLRAGNYTVSFTPPSGSTLMPEYWNDATTSTAATDVPVTLGVSTTGIDATLATGRVISGMVRGPTNQPVASGMVQLRRSSGGFVDSVDLGPSGTFEFLGLAPGSYCVRVLDDGLPGDLVGEYYGTNPDSCSGGSVIVLTATDRLDVDITLDHGATISGRVTNAAGNGIPGIGVHFGDPFLGSSWSAVTDGSGNYTISGIPPAAGSLHFEPGFGSPYAREYWDNAATASSATTIVATRGATLVRNAVLDLAGTITGQVVDDEGAPVAGVDVSADSSGGLWSTSTDATGHYTLSGVRAGSFRVYFDAPSGSGLLSEYNLDAFEINDADLVVVGAGTTVTVDAALALGATVSGTVVDDVGAPLSGIPVFAYQVTVGGYTLRGSGTTGGDGTYSIAGLTPGNYRVKFQPTLSSVWASEYFDNERVEANADPIALTVGQVRTGVDAQLERRGSISGIVTDGSGAPLEGATVTWRPMGDAFFFCFFTFCTTQTGPDGAYTLPKMEPGDYTLYIEPHFSRLDLVPEYFDNASSPATATVITIAPGEAEVANASLEIGGSISGTVLDAAGDPVPAYVSVDGPTAKSTFTDAFGHYSIVGLRAGDHTVTASPMDDSGLAPEWFDNAYEPAGATPVAVTLGTHDVVDFSLSLGATISGTVTDASGAPVESVCVTIDGTYSGGYGCSGYTDALGHYSIAGIGTRSVAVCFESLIEPLAPECRGNTISGASATLLPVVAGNTYTGVDATLSAGGSITGVVLGIDGSPLARDIYIEDPSVAVTDPLVGAGTVAYAFSEADGIFMAGPLTAGTYRVRALDWSAGVVDPDAPVLGSVVVTEGGTTNIELRYGGVVATAPGAPTGVSGSAGAGQVVLSWTAPASDGGSAVTDYVVEVSSNAGSSWTTFADGVSSSTGATVTGLSNGTPHVFRVSAKNVAGTGASSAVSSAVTPRTVPGAPVSPAGVAGAGQVVLSWSAPSSDGGSAITDYVVEASSNAGANWATFPDGVSASTGATVIGLTNGTPYVFRVSAVNAAGTGPAAEVSVSEAITPRTVPGAPGRPTAPPGSARAVLTWTAPSSTGGAPITDYTVQFSSDAGSTWTTFADGVRSTTGATVTGLTNGRSYTFRVSAVNVAGTGAASVASVASTPRTVPGVPRTLAGRAGVKKVTLTWTAPASNGGSAITDYVVQFSSNGGTTWTTFTDGVRSATGATVTGLVSKKAYVFRVAAKNVAGTGAYTVKTGSIKPT